MLDWIKIARININNELIVIRQVFRLEFLLVCNNHWEIKWILKPSKRKNGKIWIDNVWIEHIRLIDADGWKRNVIVDIKTKNKENWER